MALVFTSATAALARGTLNWDTQVKADLAALQTLFDLTMVDRTNTAQLSGDWSAITQPGAYSTSQGLTNTNAPTGVTLYGLLVVFKAWTTRVQVYFPNDTSALAYRQNYDGNAWSAWRHIATTV